MKRIAAMGALVITMLAVPAAGAMASTGGTGAGYTGPRTVQVACPLIHRKGHVRAWRLRHRHGRPVFRDGFLFVNKEAAITDGTGFMACAR